MSDDKFQALNDKVESLISLCVEMKQENQLLRANEETWHSERRELMEKNKVTKSRLEAILARLKALEEAR
ncbi:MAG: TIGR02449 family protein [Gammaproteobacteria bacterium]|nr:TIGR02449 family protein [Pseudomonadales bacterium]MCP5348136.1 TIGR02449 family protein [Pseudomonadales bacterium]